MPTISFLQLQPNQRKTPTHNLPTASLHPLWLEAQSLKIAALRRKFFVMIVLRVQVHGGLDLLVAQHTLHSFRVHLPLVHQPSAQRVTQVMQPEAMPLRNIYAGGTGSRTEMILDERRSAKRYFAVAVSSGSNSTVR